MTNDVNNPVDSVTTTDETLFDVARCMGFENGMLVYVERIAYAPGLDPEGFIAMVTRDRGAVINVVRFVKNQDIPVMMALSVHHHRIVQRQIEWPDLSGVMALTYYTALRGTMLNLGWMMPLYFLQHTEWVDRLINDGVALSDELMKFASLDLCRETVFKLRIAENRRAAAFAALPDTEQDIFLKVALTREAALFPLAADAVKRLKNSEDLNEVLARPDIIARKNHFQIVNFCMARLHELNPEQVLSIACTEGLGTQESRLIMDAAVAALTTEDEFKHLFTVRQEVELLERISDRNWVVEQFNQFMASYSLDVEKVQDSYRIFAFINRLLQLELPGEEIQLNDALLLRLNTELSIQDGKHALALRWRNERLQPR